jgi:hypothetical protein
VKIGVMECWSAEQALYTQIGFLALLGMTG